MTVNIEDIRINREIRDLLFHFDFDVLDSDDQQNWFVVEGGEQWGRFAGDGSGGCYIRPTTDGPIAFVSSEGAASIIAQNLEECLQLVIACPYWITVIRPDIDAMRAAAHEEEEAALDDNEDLDDHREALCTLLQLKPSGRELEYLHRAITTSGRDLKVSPLTDRAHIMSSLLGR
jgi:hypothetical protein